MRSSDAVLVVVALALSAGCASTSGGAAQAKPVSVSSLPDFELNAVGGDTVRLSDHLGKDVVMLAFWDTWCEPCKTELPFLDTMYAKHKARGFTLLAISMDEPTTVSQVAPYVREHGFGFTVLLDPDGKASNLYNTHKVAPYTVIIGRDGTIASETPGFEAASAAIFEARVDSLLNAK